MQQPDTLFFDPLCSDSSEVDARVASFISSPSFAFDDLDQDEAERLLKLKTQWKALETACALHPSVLNQMKEMLFHLPQQEHYWSNFRFILEGNHIVCIKNRWDSVFAQLVYSLDGTLVIANNVTEEDGRGIAYFIKYVAENNARDTDIFIRKATHEKFARTAAHARKILPVVIQSKNKRKRDAEEEAKKQRDEIENARQIKFVRTASAPAVRVFNTSHPFFNRFHKS